MRLVTKDSPGFWPLWEKLWAATEHQHPLYTPLHATYYQEYHQLWQFEDVSFVVEKGGHPVCGVRMTVDDHAEHRKSFGFYRLPILFVEPSRHENVDMKGALRLVKQVLAELASKHSPHRVVYLDPLANGALSAFGKMLLEARADATPQYTQAIDLRHDEKRLHQDLRKSYKATVNWGKRNLDVVTLDHSNVGEEDMRKFQQLHMEAAGRETRTKKTWEIQHVMIQNREAFAVFGYLAGSLVTAGFFPYTHTDCYYGVSASRRDMFDRPLSHVVLWTAIQYARNLGIKRFETGDQYFLLHMDGEHRVSDKELTISQFKRGFGGETLVHLRIVARGNLTT